MTMDEIKRSLTSGSGPEVIRAVDKLHAIILSKSGECEELSLLWSMLGSSLPLTAQVCGSVLASLVKQRRLSIQPCVSQLLASLSHGMDYTGIVPCLGSILLIQSHLQTEHYTCPYSISSSQHPFISILRSTPSAWGLVLDQCLRILILPRGLPMLRPVLLYLFCDPNHHDHFGSIRSVLLKKIVTIAKTDETFYTFLLDLLSWLQLDNKSSLPEVAQIVLEVVELTIEKEEEQHLQSQMLVIPALVLAQVRHGFSPENSLEVLMSLTDRKIETDWDAVSVILEKALRAASPCHQAYILPICLRLIQDDLVSRLAAGILASTCLQDLVLPATLYPDTTNMKAELVRLFYKMEEQPKKNRNLPEIKCSFHLSVSSALQTAKLLRQMCDTPSLILEWMTVTSSLPHTSLTTSSPLLSSLFLYSSSPQEAKLCLDLLLECVKQDSSLSSSLLTLLTHRLSRTSSPHLRLALLQALPSMAGDKGCISLIMKLVSSLSPRQSMAPLRLSLLLRLWRVEPRCYPLLQAALLEGKVPEGFSVEYRLAQAVVVKDVVTTHAAQYGSDLLPLLSTLINQSEGEEEASTASIALEGIAVMCREGVIDMRTTVQVLAPRCGKDTRTKVLCTYIKLLALAPTFTVQGEEYAKFLLSLLTWLWNLAGNPQSSPSVQDAAYTAISAFPLESSTLRMLPLHCRKGLRLPARFCSTPQDAARRPEDVLPYIPGECWAKLVTQGGGANTLLAQLLRRDVASLPRPLYAKSSTAEPASYSHLAEASVLRGLVSSLLTSVSTHESLCPHPSLQPDPALVCLLQLLSGDLGRPLPPLDWTFLSPLLEDGVLRSPVIVLLCRQSSVSRSARTLVHRHLSSEQARDTTLAYMQCLPVLAHTLPPSLLGLFVLNSVTDCVGLQVTSGEETGDIRIMLEQVKLALEDSSVPEENQKSLSQSLESVLDYIPEQEDSLFTAYLTAATRLPHKSLERLSSPSSCGLDRAVRLRTALATSQVTDTRLTWLNEVIEASCNCSTPPSSLLCSVQCVATQARTGPTQSYTSWILELLGQTNVLFRKSSQHIDTALPLLLDVFSLTLCVLTECDTLLYDRDLLHRDVSVRLSLLPLATARLVSSHPDLAGGVSSWMLSVLQQSSVSPDYRSALARCLPGFRYTDVWSEATMWGRIVLAH